MRLEDARPKITAALKRVWPGLYDRQILADLRFTGDASLREAVIVGGFQLLTPLFFRFMPIPQRPEERKLRFCVEDEIIEDVNLGKIIVAGWLTTETAEIISTTPRPDLAPGAKVAAIKAVPGPMMNITSLVEACLIWKADTPKIAGMVQQFGVEESLIPAAFPKDLGHDLMTALQEDIPAGKVALWGFDVQNLIEGGAILTLAQKGL